MDSKRIGIPTCGYGRMLLSMLTILLLAGKAGMLCGQELGEIEKLGIGINTEEYDEASPVVTLDGQYLFFTRTGSPDFDRTLIIDGRDISADLSPSAYSRELSYIYGQIAGVPVRDPALSPYNQDIHIARHNLDGAFDTILHPGHPLNNAFPNSVLSAAADTSRLIVINQFFESGSLKAGFSEVIMRNDGTFTNPQPIHIYDFYSKSGDANLAMNLGGTVMVLSLEHETTYGRNDLYVSFKINNDLWTEPTNLGPAINTPFQESTPFITRDGRHLYFASDRPGSAGGMDIWVSNRLDYTWKKWSEPKRLVEPINSRYDDAQVYLDETNNYIYFSSKRDGTSDIFRVSLLPKPKLSKPLRIKGRVVDGNTGRPIRAELYFGPEELDGYLEYFHTYTGVFEIELQEYELYKFFARKPGYQPARLMFDARLADMQDLEEHFMVLKLYKAVPIPRDSLVERRHDESDQVSMTEKIAKMEVGEKLAFYNIYFKQSEAVVLKRSHPALDTLVEGMRANVELHIRIEGHTDNVGNREDLMELSWQRAEAIKTYLVDNGISASRIETVGFGPEFPIADNSTEENRRKNRRVEIRRIKTE